MHNSKNTFNLKLENLSKEPGNQLSQHDTVHSFLVRVRDTNMGDIPEVCHPLITSDNEEVVIQLQCGRIIFKFNK